METVVGRLAPSELHYPEGSAPRVPLTANEGSGEALPS